MSLPCTLGELRKSHFSEQRMLRRSVKDELRENLLTRLRAGSPVFPGIVGYDDTVIPQLVNAILSRHNFILLGLRGQAKSRILRALTGLLDEQSALHRRMRDPRQSLRPALPPLQRSAGQRRRPHSHRLDEARRALRREARHPGRHHRRSHRRHRSHQSRARRTRARQRAGHPLRPAAPRQPRHLRRQRTA